MRLFTATLLSLALASAASADFTASGVFRYRDRAFTFNSGFTGSEPTLPVRKAFVQVLDNGSGAVLANGTTDDTGAFSILVPGTGTRDIAVRCQSRSQLFGGSRVRVTTTSDVLYSVSSAVFAGWSQDTNLNVGTVTAEKVFSGAFQANPFNLLDMGVLAVEYVMSLGSGNPTGDINLRWPVSGDSFASGFTAFMSDDDGYDDVVILHELGHVVHNMFSQSDSPGGTHSFGDSDQDPRLSYGEGWASFFAGAVRQFAGVFDPGIYLDANGTSAGFIQLRARLENASPFTSSTSGEANEVGVACMLWDIVDTTATNDGGITDDDGLDGSVTFAGGIDGDQMQWNTFTGPVATAPNLTIRNHWNAFFAPVNHGSYDLLRDVFDAFETRNYLDALEPNNGTATASPIPVDGSWQPIRTLYYSAGNPPAPGEGDSDFYSFSLNSGDGFEAETRYPNGAADADTYVDPYIRVRRPNGTILAQTDSGGVGRNARLAGLVADQTGTWTVEVTTIHGYRRTGSYQVRVKRDGITVTSVSPSTVPVLTASPNPITITGVGLSNVTGMTLGGVPLAPIFLGTGNYLILNDSTITLSVLPTLPVLGTLDLVISSATASVTRQLTVQEVASPLLTTSSPLTNQVAGITMNAASKVQDWMWVCVSTFNTPTVFPGLTTLAIGADNAFVYVAWKPFISPSGKASIHFGPLSDLAGVTLYWQAFVLQVQSNYDPPWPTTSVVNTLILF